MGSRVILLDENSFPSLASWPNRFDGWNHFLDNVLLVHVAVDGLNVFSDRRSFGPVDASSESNSLFRERPNTDFPIKLSFSMIIVSVVIRDTVSLNL